MVNRENITKFLIEKFYIIIAFSALVLAVLMVLQIAFISQNVDISECLAYAEIFEESSDDLVESVDSLDEGAVKSSYGNVSSVFSQRAEEYKSMAYIAIIKWIVYSIFIVFFISTAVWAVKAEKRLTKS